MIGGKGGRGGKITYHNTKPRKRAWWEGKPPPKIEYTRPRFGIGMRTPIKPTKRSKIFRGNPKVNPENTNNKGGAMLGVGLGRAVGAVAKLTGRIGYGLGSTLARQGVSLGRSVGRSALRQGRATAKAYRKSAAKRAMAKRDIAKAKSLRNSVAKRDMGKPNSIIQGRNNQNVGNNVINNSSYKPYHNQVNKRYLCNPTKMEIILPNDTPPPPYIIAELNGIYYRIPIPNGTEPGSKIKFTQPMPPIENVGQTPPDCHTKSKPTIVNHIPLTNSEPTQFTAKDLGFTESLKGININLLKKAFSSGIIPESLKDQVNDSLKSGIISESLKNALSQKGFNSESLKDKLNGLKSGIIPKSLEDVSDKVKQHLSKFGTGFDSNSLLKEGFKKGLNSGIINKSRHRNLKMGARIAQPLVGLVGTKGLARLAARASGMNSKKITQVENAAKHLSRKSGINYDSAVKGADTAVKGLLKQARYL